MISELVKAANNDDCIYVPLDSLLASQTDVNGAFCRYSLVVKWMCAMEIKEGTRGDGYRIYEELYSKVFHGKSRIKVLTRLLTEDWKSDLYPVAVTSCGWLYDGEHRVAAAIVKGMKGIHVRLCNRQFKHQPRSSILQYNKMFSVANMQLITCAKQEMFAALGMQ